MFPDADAALRVFLAEEFNIPEGSHGKHPPDNFVGVELFLWSYRYSGKTPDEITDYSRVNVGLFKKDNTGELLAKEIRAKIFTIRGKRVLVNGSPVRIDSVREEEAFIETPYQPEGIRLWESKWELSVRR